MTKWSRRDFLRFSASAGVAALAAVGGDGATVRAGMLGWNERSRFMATAFREIPELRVAALSGLASDYQYRMLLSAFSGGPPALYPTTLSMHADRAVDFLYAPGESPDLADWPGHLLLEDAVDPHKYVDPGSGSRCVQILPRFEFSGCGRSAAALSGEWNLARIDCRSKLPDKPFAGTSDLAAWLFHEAGEAVDFAYEVMGLTEDNRIFTVAAPAATPFEARLGWCLRESGRAGKTIEVSIHATHASDNSSWTKIRLCGLAQSVLLQAAPRSMEFTRQLTANFLDAVNERRPDQLLYSPSILLRAHTIVSEATMGMSA
jgi:hypothetical protein